ncbi:MAG: hypothetical protein COB67_00585 [SAR324 cluster bacterium]|uniref:Uncharacterized protein n=1 Tax=SAR324 cluster bacterium TaxID=2024889 RepID=A0A2A4TBS9_9DELT|nr:MAG: hypothetical protein COB67_00585 [SAR324 cluster bacterium]
MTKCLTCYDVSKNQDGSYVCDNGILIPGGADLASMCNELHYGENILDIQKCSFWRDEILTKVRIRQGNEISALQSKHTIEYKKILKEREIRI